MNYSLKTMSTIVICMLTLLGCKKDTPQKDEDELLTEETVPSNKQEASKKITGKWNVSSTGEVRSIEFLEGDIYIMEVNNSSPLVASKPPLKPRTLLAQSNNNFKAEAQTNSSNEIVKGTFVISEDGKTIKLDNIINLVITGVSASSFSFTITFLEDNRKQTVSATLSKPVDATDNTKLIAGTWGPNKWASFDLPNKTIFESHGFKPQDQGLTFTSSGTMIMRYINYEQSSVVDPETGQSSEIKTNLSIESDVYHWTWKDSAQKVIKASRGGDSFDINITTLTKGQLNARLPNGNTWEMVRLQVR